MDHILLLRDRIRQTEEHPYMDASTKRRVIRSLQTSINKQEARAIRSGKATGKSY